MSALMKKEQIIAESGVNEADGQYLTFLLAGEMFAIDILNIKEIIEYGQITGVPMMPGFVRGVINLRGRVVPVVDLQVRFGRQRAEIGKRTCVVIIDVEVEGERQDIGVVVDAVSEVRSIPLTDIEKAPAFGARLRPDFIDGMGKIQDKFIIILNVSQVLSVDEMARLVQATIQQQQGDDA